MKLSDIDILSVGNSLNLVGAVWAGEGKAIICMLPGAEAATTSGQGVPLLIMDGEEHVINTMNMGTDEWERFIRQTDLMETEVLGRAKDGKIAKIIVRKSSRNVEPHVCWKVYARDDFRCRYCNRKGGEAPLSVDHLVLWEEGGPSTEENLLTSCRKCNKARGNTQYADWLKSDHYKSVSAFLPVPIADANAAIVARLSSISKKPHVQSR